MDLHISYSIVTFYLILSILFNSIIFITGTTVSLENDNESKSQDSDLKTVQGNAALKNRRRLTVQNFLLIWLDSDINESDKNYQDSVTKFREVINVVYTFTNADQFIDFLNQINDEKVFLIISESFLESIMPRIHDMLQLDSIFVFPRSESKHETSVKKWDKIKGEFTKIDLIVRALKRSAQQCDRDSLSFSVMSVHSDQLYPTFLYTSAMKKVLLQVKNNGNLKKELADFSRKQYQNNSQELQKINGFERDYRLDTAIWWYNQKCFLYQMLSRALRTQENEVIMKLGFFVRDTHRQIEDLHLRKTQNKGLFFVYRGQGITDTELTNMKNAGKNSLLVFNNFLSGSLNKKFANEYARNSMKNPDLHGIVFNMTIKTPNLINPFVSRRQVDAFANDKEGILFSIYTVFRLTDIKPIENRFWEIELTLIQDDDEQWAKLFERAQKETSKLVGWQHWGDFLMRMKYFDQAEQVYQGLLDTTPNTEVKEFSRLCNQLGKIQIKKQNYMKALELFTRALEIQDESLSPNHPDFVSTYSNFGLVYNNIGEYSKALNFYRKTLDIQQKFLPSNHPNLISIYNGIGLAYRNMEEYSKSIEFYQKAFEIQKGSLSSNNRDFANAYNNLASVYYKMKEYSKALSFYEEALKICQKSFRSDHSYLTAAHQNIGLVYKDMGQFSKALESFGRVLEIQQEFLSQDDSDLANTYENIASVYYSIAEYSKALEFFNKTLEIRQHSLPSNHPDMATVYYHIGLIYYHMDQASIAQTFFERAVQSGHLSLPENYSNIEPDGKHIHEL